VIDAVYWVGFARRVGVSGAYVEGEQGDLGGGRKSGGGGVGVGGGRGGGRLAFFCLFCFFLCVVVLVFCLLYAQKDV